MEQPFFFFFAKLAVQSMVYSVEQFKSKQIVVDSFHGIHASVAPVGICCQAGHHCSSKSSQVGKNIAKCFSPLEV